jgi:hypothetical protein
MALASVYFVGCTNDPFDPESVVNKPPVARIFVSSEQGEELNPTSYNKRTFHWSGSDEDGFVVEFYVTIEVHQGVPAPWDTTTATDTTMTFVTDDEGNAEATIRVACRDDRGALSDTVSQYIPLRNFPPFINFQADYDTMEWSFGAANFRYFALDLDGNETMADSFRFKLDTADTNIVRIYGQPDADPAVGWVRKAFTDLETRTFTVDLHAIPPAEERTLTVSVTDEARADSRFDYTWEVREPKGPILLVSDASPFIDEFYFGFMDATFGVGQWTQYEILTAGFPDRNWVLTETFRQFEAVLWYVGGGASQNLKEATEAITEYVIPTDGISEIGRFLLVSQRVTGANVNLPFAFIQEVLGILPTAAPANYFTVPEGNQALGQQAYLPALTAANAFGGAAGLNLRSGTEALYVLESCQDCYCDNPIPNLGCRPPWDPIVAVRRPARNVDPLASVVTLSIQLERFQTAEARAALLSLFSLEMGVSLQ